MIHQQLSDHPIEGPRLDAAIRTADFQARHLARSLSLSDADRDDLQQDILLVVMAKAPCFDGSRSGWPTFVAMIARHAGADLARRCGSAPFAEPIDEVEHALADPSMPDQNLRIDLQDALSRLPRSLADLVELVAETGCLAAAQKVSTLPSATFYRRVHDLRMRLVAAGLAPW